MASRKGWGAKCKPWKLPSSSKRLRLTTSTFSLGALTILEGKSGPDLRSDQVQARVRIGLAAVGEVLIERAEIEFPVIVHEIIHSHCREDIESEILSLAAAK